MYTRFLLSSVYYYYIGLKEICDKKVSINDNVNVHKNNCNNSIIIYRKSISIFHEIGKINIFKNFLVPLDSKSTAKKNEKTTFSPKSQPGECLAVCLIFVPISAWSAYKLRAYKKKCVSNKCVFLSREPRLYKMVRWSIDASACWSVRNAFARQGERSRRMIYFVYTNLFF